MTQEAAASAPNGVSQLRVHPQALMRHPAHAIGPVEYDEWRPGVAHRTDDALCSEHPGREVSSTELGTARAHLLLRIHRCCVRMCGAVLCEAHDPRQHRAALPTMDAIEASEPDTHISIR